VTQKRHAYAAALSASAIPALVMARGHKIDQVSEIPLVLDNKTVDTIDKTSAAVALLKTFAAYDDVEKVEDSIKMRCGKGKMRNRRWTQRRGPLVIYNKAGPMVKAFRNIPGVELCSVHKLNLLQLAPGGHIGRFIVWTRDAFEQLNTLFGTYRRSSQMKEGYTLPRGLISNTDLHRLMNSEEIQSVLRDKKTQKNSKTIPKTQSPQECSTQSQIEPTRPNCQET
jgi:large subunit ribosomal protein L4e